MGERLNPSLLDLCAFFPIERVSVQLGVSVTVCVLVRICVEFV